MTLLNASTVLRHAASLSGQPVNEDEGIDRDTHSMLTAAWHARLQVIWRADAWPEVIRTERRRKTADYFVHDGTYIPGAVIVWRKDGRAYLVVAPFLGDTGHEPSDETLCAPLPPPLGLPDIETGKSYNAGQWIFDPATNLPLYCSQDGSSGFEKADLTKFFPLPALYFPEFELQNYFQTQMDNVLRVTDIEPNGNQDEEDIPYVLTGLGVRVHGDPGLAWMQFRIVPPPVSGDPWDDGRGYVSTQQDSETPVEVPQVYYEVNLVGNYYDVIDTTLAGQSPSTHPAKFRRVEIPALFGTWLSYALAADWLRMDGQTDKAADREASATLELVRLKDNLHRQQRQVSCLPVMSR